ncbi:MAG TPA: transglycosylase SLT domain-containing protein [Alphaproteobacteria bacterium]|nr:transglycosylase SLT domain-containing protein [Alphaproteobacteria bacterium]
MSVATIDLSSLTGDSVTQALANASRATGVNFGYLLSTAKRESSLNPDAKSKTSSATGLFQFVEQTWLRALKTHGADHGFAAEAAAIDETPSGKLTVADPAQRQAILALRKDPNAAALMAAEMTRDSKDLLERTLGRSVNDGELYLAHFFGAGGAAKFIAQSDAAPDQLAAPCFPDAAASNPSIFYHSDGSARSLSEVKSQLALLNKDGGTPRSAPNDTDTGDDVPSAALASLIMRGDASAAAPFMMPTSQPMTLTPQILAILSTLDPVPDSQTAQKGYSNLLTAQIKF